MYDIYLCANRGINGLYTKKKVVFAPSDVLVERIDKTTVHVSFIKNNTETETVVDKYIIDSDRNGNWEHFYIKNAVTGRTVHHSRM